MPASSVGNIGSEQDHRDNPRASFGRRMAALVGCALCWMVIAAWLIMLTLVFVPVISAGIKAIFPPRPVDHSLLDPLIGVVTLGRVTACLAAGVLLWSAGRVLAGKGEAGLNYWWQFEAAMREAKSSLLLIWLGALIDGALLLPKMIEMLVLLAVAFAVVQIGAAIAVVRHGARKSPRSVASDPDPGPAPDHPATDPSGPTS